jgi:GNAT superfamily N-acetyltransferase
MAALTIRPVRSRRDLTRFIKLPLRLYREEPNWVAPLVFERRRFLDRARNPFFEHADAEYFLAERDGRVVGRISAHVDFRLQEFQQVKWGQFGFFECEQDPEAAGALLDSAEGWLTTYGCDRIVGPFDFTTNDECGVLIEGHERTPIILTPWTHAYYPELLEGAGLTKAMDTLMWELHIEGRDNVHPAIWDMAAAVSEKHGITCRHFRKSDLENEVKRFMEVYNAAWERNWGFVPLTENEVREYAKTLRPFLSEDWAMVAEKDDGTVVGAALTLPDWNQVLRHMRGRVLPFGWLKALRHRKDIDRVRVFALGVKPEYQHTGVAARFYQMHFDSAERTPQSWGEMGWILETNTAMNRAMEGMGGRIVRRYRLYERMIGDPPPSVDLSGAGTEAEAAADLSAGEPGAAGPSSGP